MALTQTEYELIEALRFKLRGMEYVRLTDAEVALRRARRPSTLGSLAIEDMYLDDADLALTKMLDEESVPAGLDTKIILEFTNQLDALDMRRPARAVA
jgi:hypothetical protein